MKHETCRDPRPDPCREFSHEMSPCVYESLEDFFAQLPERGVLLALDFGRRRIGIAASTAERSLAVALPVLWRKNLRVDLGFLRHLFAERAAVGWVVGLPLSLSGKESAMSCEVRHFVEKLSAKNPQPLLLFDERFTSALVERAAREVGGRNIKKATVDSQAATLLLQNCLEVSRTCKSACATTPT